MSEVLKLAKSRPLKFVSKILHRGYRWAQLTEKQRAHPYLTSQRDQLVRRYSFGGREEECKALLSWAETSPQEVEVYMSSKSPSTMTRWALQSGRRMCKEAEDIIRLKARNKSVLLEYCTHFGVVVPDTTTITVKAAFDNDSHREKEYIRKMELEKKRVFSFLLQLIEIGAVDPEMKIKDLVETL